MKACKSKLFLFMIASLLAFVTFAKTCTWTGGAGTANWIDAANWDMKPEKGDTVIFKPQGSLTVNCPESNSTSTGWPIYRPSAIRVESGEVTINTGAYEFSMEGLNHEFYVGGQASAVIVLNVGFGVFANGYVLRKTGEGKLTFKGSPSADVYLDRLSPNKEDGSLGYWRSRESVSVDEGILRLEAGEKIIYFNCTNVVVASGAKLEFDGDCRFNLQTLLMLNKDSNFEMTDSSSTFISAVTGAGNIHANDGSKMSVITFALKTPGVAPFTGLFSGNLSLNFYSSDLRTKEAAAPFVVQSANQLAGIVGVRYSDRFFKYASGVGEFKVGALDGWTSYTTNYIQDVNGDPITIRAGLKNINGESVTQVYKGPGSLWVTSAADQGIRGSNCLLTGWLGAAEGGKLVLGDGRGDDFDLTKATGKLKGVRSESGGTVLFNHKNFANIELPVRGSGTYEVSAAAGAKFTDLKVEGAQALLLRSECEIAGGDVSVKEMQTNASGRRSALTRISGGRIYNGTSKGTKETDTDIKSPDGIKTTGNIGGTSLEITGGDFYWLSGNSICDIFLRGGVFHPNSGAVRNLSNNMVANSAPPYQLVFDGGTAHLYAKFSEVFQFFKFNDLNDRADTTVIYVTDKGGRIIAQKPNGQANNYTFITTNAFVTCTNTAVSGALVFSGWGDFVFGAPMDLNGPVEFRDGTAIVTGPQLAGSNTPFGTGDLRLRNARLFCDERSGAGHGIGAINLASGTDSAIVYEGSCELATRNENGNTAVKTVVANAIRRAGAGAALYLRDGTTTSTLCPRVGEAGFSTVKLAKAPQMDERTGLLREPVLIGSLSGEFLATYDAEKGFVPHDTIYDHATSDLGALDDGTKVFSPEAGTTHELAANAEAHIAAASFGNFAKVILYENAKLKVGNGADPAILLLGVCGRFQGMLGTIDFGTSEGVISCNNCTDVPDNNNSIACKIDGSNGVSYVSDPEMSRDRRLELYCDNPYAGATHISAVRIGARHERCFSSGDVYVLGGEAAGGAVVFKKMATWANTFHIAGHGYHDLSENSSLGCLEFMENATISGDVEIAEEASVNVRAGYTGVISGKISGDRLKLYRSEGLLKLAGENTYTGGTCVARSTLAVSKPTGLGTGAVLLDGGSVVFDNAETMGVANDWDGVGTICVTGAEVKFSGAINASTITLDLPNDIALSEIPPFSKITNSSTRASTLTLAAKEGAHELDPSAVQGVFNLVLADGASLDLGGKTLVVRRFEGDRASVNGVISETNPKKGAYIFVR